VAGQFRLSVPRSQGPLRCRSSTRGNPAAALEERRDLTQPLIEKVVRRGVSTMLFFRKAEISDAELQALAAYLARSPDQRIRLTEPEDCP